ncbi:serine/threonine protein phosphatase [hydrothermal vent metagenome]|uniref:Serine/threonine protein phosphatase n=1 Tax=hydrothermal vent metagenome TaxID=652676 RepID=A0A1W1C5D0_9ZZZZ
MNNTYIIGDVHGCLYTLKVLLTKLPKNANIIFVGDLIDKGNFSKEVISLVIENNYQCILGNHEALMINHIEDALLHQKESDWSTKKYFGGYKTIASYSDDMTTLKEHLSWLKTLPRYMEIDKYFITHAFALPYYKRRNNPNSYNGLMSNRPSDIDEWGWDWEDEYENYDVINIYGHQIVKKIDTSKNHIGIDTGAYRGYCLSAMCLDSKEIISVSTDIRDVK